MFDAFKQLRNICEWHFPSPLSMQFSQVDVIAEGADLSPATLLKAYSNGLFPWYDKPPILWWSPHPRCVFFPAVFKPSRSLKRFAQHSNWHITINQNFNKVIESCAEPRPKEPGTWLQPEVIYAYQELSRLGFGFSIEVWNEETLVGGLYGVKIGAAVFGESMFSQESNASKVALWFLMELCKKTNIELVDAQVDNPHTLSLGAQLIARPLFIEHICGAIDTPHSWKEYEDRVYPCKQLASDIFNTST